jgi:hypothetical protein
MGAGVPSKVTCIPPTVVDIWPFANVPLVRVCPPRFVPKIVTIVPGAMLPDA